MKCKFCGAKIKKTDELCPECGKLINSRKSASDMGECLKKFNCNDNLPSFIFIIFLSIVILGFVAKDYIVSETIDFKSVAAVVSGIIIIPMMSWLCLVTCKSYICVCENGIYGVIPQQGKPVPTFFELPYDEIKAVGLSVTKHNGAATCMVAILTRAEKEYKIGYLNQKNSKLLSDMLHHRLDKQDKDGD